MCRVINFEEKTWKCRSKDTKYRLQIYNKFALKWNKKTNLIMYTNISGATCITLEN